MTRLWENPVEVSEMGVHAEARYRELFTAEEMGRRWATLYREVLAEKAQALPEGRTGEASSN
ncbi:hypothetical protein D3C84_1013360 [compost metagenome]